MVDVAKLQERVTDACWDDQDEAKDLTDYNLGALSHSSDKPSLTRRPFSNL